MPDFISSTRREFLLFLFIYFVLLRVYFIDNLTKNWCQVCFIFICSMYLLNCNYCLAFKALGKLILDVGLMLAFHCDQYGKFSNISTVHLHPFKKDMYAYIVFYLKGILVAFFISILCGVDMLKLVSNKMNLNVGWFPFDLEVTIPTF